VFVNQSEFLNDRDWRREKRMGIRETGNREQPEGGTDGRNKEEGREEEDKRGNHSFSMHAGQEILSPCGVSKGATVARLKS